MRSKDREGKVNKWIIDLNNFLPFYSDPGFRKQLQNGQHNLYSSMAFWIFDNAYGANFIHNISNRKCTEVQDLYFIEDMQAVFHEAEATRNNAEEGIPPLEEEHFVQLREIVDRGDLSFAPSPFLDTYEHTRTKEDLSLAVINKMKVIKKPRLLVIEIFL